MKNLSSSSLPLARVLPFSLALALACFYVLWLLKGKKT
ncbi:hypothetical protein A2U01_0093992 [Trifolium medium]|uniref:Uncharacterized protein n=1 Tax=Trifolium medium TaxID=97028 RepID=A0A392UIH7_9FABA|nr:hypothetical protein [Trifolium medium]